MKQGLDYLIIGQGLAGSLLAWQLIKAGQQVLVIDADHPVAASRVAAGLINPVTGKRLVKEPQVERYLAAAEECYRALGDAFAETFLHHQPMLRLFDSDAVKQQWQRRREEADYQGFIADEVTSSDYPQGGFLQQQTGYLSVALLLAHLREWLKTHSALLDQSFDYDELTLDDGVSWQGHRAKQIIFCEGARVSANPWFASLPMQPAQGDILTLACEGRLPEWIINGGRWLLPLDETHCKLGATYIWPSDDRPLDGQPREASLAVLLEQLPELAPAIGAYRLVAHEAGVRPNSKDKRPLIGFHPEYSQLAVFNGFGSKGSMLIPYYAQHFVEVLSGRATLEADVDIRRCL